MMKTSKMLFSIILSLVILVVSQLAAQVIASVFVMIKVPEFICNIIAGGLYILLAFSLIKLLCRKYLKDNMCEYYIPKFKLDLKWLCVAVALPVFVCAVFLLFMDGSFIKNELDRNSKLNLLSAGIFFAGFGAGIVEELVFRGIMMSVLEKRFNKIVAILAPSLLFGAVHIIGMEFSLLSSILVIVAGTMVGVMFSLIASATKSVWNSAIVHAMWNIVILGGFLWIGTEFDEYSLVSYVLDSKAFAITGGEFGIESSVIAVIGYCVVILLVLFECKIFKKKA